MRIGVATMLSLAMAGLVSVALAIVLSLFAVSAHRTV